MPEIRFILFCEEIFHSSFGMMKYPYTKIFHLNLQTRIHHSLVLVIIFTKQANITYPDLRIFNFVVYFSIVLLSSHCLSFLKVDAIQNWINFYKVVVVEK